MYVKLGIFLLIGLLVICEESSQNRLPDDIYPIHYNVWLNFTRNTNQYFNGIVTIVVGIETGTNQIQLNGEGIFIDAVVLREKNSYRIIPVLLSRGNQTTIIELECAKQLLEVGKLYELKFSYSGYYGSFAGQDNSRAPHTSDFVIANHVFPFSIQYVLPCYDEPQYKATFVITIQHDLGTTAVSNMAAVSVVPDVGYLTTTFAKTPLLSTYSVAFAITNYDRVERAGKNINITAFYGNLYQSSDVKFVLDINEKVLGILETYLNFALDINEINLVPVYQLPIRNFGTLGLLINRHSYHYYNSNNSISTTVEQDNLVRYVCKFYANKYFGSLISPEWWSQLWLNQGITKLLEYTIANQMYPELQQMDLYFYKIFTQAHTLTESAIEANIESRQDIVNHLNSSHGSWKATAMIYMIQNLLTEHVFKLGLNQILMDRAYLPTNTKDIFAILTNVAHKNGALNEQQDMYTIFEKWITNCDLPVLTVLRDYTTGNVTVTQSAADGSSSIWIVPYNYMTQTNTTNWKITTADGWLENVPSVVLDLSAELNSTDWVIFNREFSAYYQTNYDSINWHLLAKQLRRDHEKIPRHTRGQLMHDVYTFWISGAVSYNIMFYFFSYLNRETSPVPLQPFLVYVSDKDPLFYGTEMYSNFTTFAMNQLSPVYERVRIKDSTKQILTIFDEINQAKVLTYSCRMNYHQCLEDAQGLLNIYLESNKIGSGKEILSYGFVLSDENQFWEVFGRINNVENRDGNLVKMLGFTQNTVNIEHLLNILITKNREEYNGVTINLEIDDRVTIFEVLQLNNLKAIDLVYDVVENESKIIKEIMGDDFHWIILNLVGHITTAQKYDQILRIVPLYRTDERDFEVHKDMAKSTLITITNLIEQTQDVLAYLIENEIDLDEEAPEEEDSEEKEYSMEEEEEEEEEEDEEEEEEEEEEDKPVINQDDGIGGAVDVTLSATCFYGLIIKFLNMGLIIFI